MNFYEKAYRLLAGGLRRLFRIEIKGAENEPADGGLIVCPNHLSNMDVLIVAVSLKRQVHFMAKAELFKIPLLKGLITTLGAFPVDRKASDVGAIKRCIAMLKEGKVIGFYPQGHRFPGVDPAKSTIKSGIGMIVNRSQTTVLPVCIQCKGYRIRPFRKTYVTIGAPVTAEELGCSASGTEEYNRISREIFDRVLELKREDISI